MTLIDASIGSALFGMVGPDVKMSTIECKVNFVRPAITSVLIVNAKIEFLGRNTAFGVAKALNEEKIEVSYGTATYSIK